MASKGLAALSASRANYLVQMARVIDVVVDASTRTTNEVTR